jgi:Concanavalin A-like lectin/glucanases superfamily
VARASTCTWSSAAAANLSAGLWSCGHTPTSGDDVVFDGTSNKNCTVDIPLAVATISINSGYTGIVAQNAGIAVTVAGAFSQATGTFTGGSAPLKVGGGFSLSGGTFNASSGTTQIGGVFSRTNGTFAAGTGTVIFNATTSVTHAFGGRTFNKVIVNDGLVGYWNLDEGSGTSLTDRSGYANHLQLNSASFTSALPSLTFADASAVAFTGSVFAQLATTPPTNLPAATAAQTISAWVKLGATSGTQDLVVLGDGTNGLKLGLNAGVLSAWLWGGTPTSLATATTPVDGSWHQIVFSYDGSTNRLYLDGALTGSSATAHLAATASKVFLGSYDGVHELMASGGAIDDVRIYNRALTANEVSGLALGGTPAAAAVTHGFGSTFTTTGDFVIASGAVSGTGAFAIGGSWLNYGGAFTSTGAVTLSGASGVILSGGQALGGNLTVSSGSAYTLSDRLWAQNRTVTVNGTLNGGSYVAHVGTLTGAGTFNPGTGTVVLDNTATLGFGSFDNLRVEDSKNETNLVAYWKLDEGNSATFYDLTGSANTGALTGGATWTTPSPSIGFDDAAGLTFDGSTGYATMGIKNIPKANVTQTISLWAKLSSTTGVQDLVAFVDPADSSGLGIGLNGGSLNVWVAGGQTLVSMAAPSVNTWHHIAYVYSSSGAGTDQLYVDGVVNTGGGTTTTHPTFAPTSSYLGTSTGTSGSFKGQLDDVRVYSAALTAAQVAQLAAGRYAGRGGFSTVTLGANTSASGLLALDAGNLTTSTFTLSAALASAVNAGTYAVGSAAQTFSSSLTVQPGGTMTIASGGSVTSGDLSVQSPASVTVTSGSLTAANLTVQSGASLTLTGGSLAIGGGKTFTMDGTLNASSSASIKSVSGAYTFKIGSTATATPTLNITGLAVKNTDANGMWINANTSATTTFTRFDNIAFSGGTGAQLLQITAPTLYLGSSGCTFDGSTTYAVKLTGNGTGDGTETRAVFGGATCATNTSGICASSEKLDDDANNDGIGDNLGSNGAVVQFARSAGYAGGTFQGFPTAAFDWNTFSYYATYAVFRNEAGTQDVVYVRDESGNPLYSWTTPTNENIIGTPQWTTVSGTHYLYLATNNTANTGKVYRLVDNGSSLVLDTVWSALAGGNPYLCTCTIKSQLSLDASNVYWAATQGSGTVTQVLMEVGQASQSVMTGWPLTTPLSVTTSPPQLATSGGTTKLYLGISGDLLQLDVTGTTFVTNTNPGTINGRVSIGTSSAGTARVFAGDTSKVMWAISPTNFTGTNYLWKYTAASSIGGSPTYDYLTDTVQFGTSGGAVIVLTGAGNGGSPGTGVVLNAGYPFTLNASDPITSPPLYTGGVLAVGTTLGKLYFLDRNTGTTPGVAIIAEYNFGPTESVSGIAFDPNVNRYMVSTSAATKDGRLYYFDLVNDPTPTFK